MKFSPERSIILGVRAYRRSASNSEITCLQVTMHHHDDGGVGVLHSDREQVSDSTEGSHFGDIVLSTCDRRKERVVARVNRVGPPKG